jgi:hypothetical protein
VARRAGNAGEFFAGGISSEDSSRDNGPFVRNVSRKTLQRIKTLKSPLNNLFFFHNRRQK